MSGQEMGAEARRGKPQISAQKRARTLQQAQGRRGHLSSPLRAANFSKPLMARQIYCWQGWHVYPSPFDILKLTVKKRRLVWLEAKLASKIGTRTLGKLRGGLRAAVRA